MGEMLVTHCNYHEGCTSSQRCMIPKVTEDNIEEVMEGTLIQMFVECPFCYVPEVIKEGEEVEVEEDKDET